MTIILKRGVPNKQVDDLIKSSKQSVKKTDLSKYVGTIKLKEDPLKIQRKLRDEWD